MPYCPITLAEIATDQTFSQSGLQGIHRQLKNIRPLPYSNEEQLREARIRSEKMSIQGVQPKLSAIVSLTNSTFKIADNNGRFILKPNPIQYEEVPANEALTMRLAQLVGIETPVHGLLPASDGSWVYFIQRYDRKGRSQKIHVEDFAQLSSLTRETKYNSSLERLVDIVEKFCTFPAIEKPKLAKRLLFCFLTGNEDMHLKNFSLWKRDGVVSLSPAYDLLNTTIALENASEESALPLQGKQKNLSKKLWIDYYCKERLQLTPIQISAIVSDIQKRLPLFHDFIQRSFLSPNKQKAYATVLQERAERLGLTQENNLT